VTSDLSEFHDELRSVARAVLAEARPSGAAGEPSSLDWDTFAASGWSGLEVPEAQGGAGATLAEVAIVLHELGRSAQPTGYLGSVVLGVGLLNLLESTAARDELLGQLAAGRIRVGVGLATGEDGVEAFDAPFRLASTGARLRLRGAADFVPDAADADRLLLLARDERAHLVVVPVEATVANLRVVEQPVVDSTRRVAAVSAVDVDVSPDAVLRFSGDPDTGARRLFDRGALAIACDSLGLAEAMTEATVSYAGVRQQFGRPIGSFQAVKHACADMLVHVTVSRELVDSAVAALCTNESGASRAVSMAKSHVCGVALDVVGKAMQLHGGIGYTWESGIHTYLKRAAFNRSLFGSPSAHRRRLGRRYAEGVSAAAPD
jgi:alkylation response protein AidB-like acyl-CoA dehydrogenase